MVAEFLTTHYDELHLLLINSQVAARQTTRSGVQVIRLENILRYHSRDNFLSLARDHKIASVCRMKSCVGYDSNICISKSYTSYPIEELKMLVSVKLGKSSERGGSLASCRSAALDTLMKTSMELL